MGSHIVYLDVEMQRSATEVGGWNNLHKCGVSVAVALLAKDSQVRIFTEKNIKAIAVLLREADSVVGYNLAGSVSV